MTSDSIPDLLEQDLQRTLVQYLDILERQGRLLYFAIPNGGKRSKIEAAIMTGLGVRPGALDLAIIFPPDGHVLFMELKRPNKNKVPKRPSAAQIAFAERAERMGCETVVCNDFDIALGIIREKLTAPAK